MGFRNFNTFDTSSQPANFISEDGMGVTHFGRNALASSTRPIEAVEFVNALSSVLKLSNSYNGKHNGALGESFINYVSYKIT